MKFTYTPEQQAEIDIAIADTSNTADGFLTYSWSDRIVQRGNQTFAVFGSIARELMQPLHAADASGTRFEYLPVVIDGKMLQQSPDEGSSGVAYLMRMTHRRGQPASGPWSVGYIGTRWFRTAELDMTNAQVAKNIQAEIAAGDTPLSGGRQGWA